MKKKKNVYKRKINFKKIFSYLSSGFFTLVLAAFFCLLGYSVAKPFAEIKDYDPAKADSKAPLKDYIEPLGIETESSVRIYYLPEKRYEDIEELEKAVSAVSKNYSYVAVSLKMSGGELSYNSDIEEAEDTKADSSLDLSDINNTISSKGFIPVAIVNIMEDNVYPVYNEKAGFSSEKTKKLWLDASAKKSGKPWLDPSSQEALEYNSAIMEEIAESGFKYILGTKAVYPDFSQDALNTIGDSVKEEKRYLNLIDMVNKMSDSADRKGSEMWLEISAYDLLTGKCEVFDKMLLNTTNTILEIDLSKFNKNMEINGKTVEFSKMKTSEKIAEICSQIEKFIYKTSYIPEVTDKNLTSAQIKEVEDIFDEMGYDSYAVK